MTSRHFALALAISLLAGCATNKMPLGSDSDTIEAGAQPIFLMTATFKNDYVQDSQPRLGTLIVEDVEKPDEYRMTFAIDRKARDEKDTPQDGNRYLLRMGLPAGSYVVRGFKGSSGGPVPFLVGIFFAPLHADVKSPLSGVYYLGHVSATIRERKGGEFRAGPTIPLMQQSAHGFSGGTFDVEVSDRLEADLPELLAKFPALRSANIQKALLAPFDRARAQKFWEGPDPYVETR